MSGAGGMGGMPRGFKMSGNGGMNENIDPNEILKMFFGMGGLGGFGGRSRSGNTQFHTSSERSGMNFQGFEGFGSMGGFGGQQHSNKKSSFKFA